MRTSLVRLVSRILIACMIGLPFQAQAGLIGTDAVISAAQAQGARDAVHSFLNRTEVAAQLQALGLTSQAAKDRVNALTDAEVARLAGQMETLPAGANFGGIIVIGLLLWLLWWVVKK